MSAITESLKLSFGVLRYAIIPIILLSAAVTLVFLIISRVTHRFTSKVRLVFPVLLIVLVVLYFVSGFCFYINSSFSYEYIGNVSGFGIGEGFSSCFVGVVCTKDFPDNIITVPDTYNDKPITSLGGYTGRGAPAVFCLNSSPDGSEGYTLNIGKNIKTIKNADFGGISRINCSPENRRFYSEDGKLYDKRTKELIAP